MLAKRLKEHIGLIRVQDQKDGMKNCKGANCSRQAVLSWPVDNLHLWLGFG